MVLKGVLSHFALCQKDTFFKALTNSRFLNHTFLFNFLFCITWAQPFLMFFEKSRRNQELSPLQKNSLA
ncbi:hypothetical protein DTQ70_06185 [Runella sp. SP2]|nr:hypothetical protein DTQ70_06185 [Runella sp. SP2]